ncbi:MAG: HEAT repeat domain-containing protein [Planctomycetota bacterium]
MLAALSWLVLTAAAADGVVWEKEYKQAFDKAGQLKVPVLVCLNMDNEWANDELVNKIYPDPKFVAEARKCVCLIGSVFEHAKTADGMCSRFKTLTCAEHKQVEIEARKQYVGGSVAIAPQHILATPRGEVITRRAYFCKLEELVEMLQSAEAVLQGGASTAEIAKRVDATTEKKMSELRELAKTRDYKKQWALLPEVDKLGQRASRILYTEFALDKKCAEDLRKSAIARLGCKGNYDSLDTLLRLLKDDDTDIVMAAASALEVQELPQATEPLLKAYRKKPTDALKCALLRALGACGGDQPDVRALLIQGARDSNNYVRCSAAGGLGYVLNGIERAGNKDLSKSDQESTAILIRLLGDSQWTVRGAAVYALGFARVPEAKPQLEKMVQGDNAVDVRACAEGALKNLTLKGETDESLLRFRWKFSSDMLR